MSLNIHAITICDLNEKILFSNVSVIIIDLLETYYIQSEATNHRY